MSQQVEINSTPLADLFEADNYSPYGMWKVVQGILDDLGTNKTLPPQMFYNYVKKGFIKSDESKKVSKDEAVRWTEKYIAKNFS